MNRMKCIIGVFNSNWSSQTGFIFKQQGIAVNSLLRRFATSNPVSTPSIEVVDVTLSNGLENDKSFIATNNKLTLIQSLSKSGIHRIESTRFLHYKIAPQYIDALDIVTKINPLLIDSNSRSIVSAYVPSLAQLQNAIRHKTKSICISISSTSSFSMHNYKTSVDNHLLVLSDLVSFAKDKDVSVRGRIQCALGCPHEGEVDVERVKELIQKLFKMGCYEVCLEDTIGKGSVESVKMLVEGIKAENEIDISRIGMHFKNRSDGLGLLNALTAYESGIRVFEGSIGGIGRSLYDASIYGCLATEDLVWIFEKKGIRTNVNDTTLKQTAEWFCTRTGRTNRSFVAAQSRELESKLMTE